MTDNDSVACHDATVRLVGVLALVAGSGVAAWAVAVFILLARSPDSGWEVGLQYSLPVLLAAAVTAATGVHLMRRR